ncbi:hypothetical protein K5X82_02670 [Halosquirtibacter xylanolyticus]|uniref:hypothetical protein n=1 Tax=Halosquirtibacter xylanolyticus TaxID=3374599 RepID=UPI0037499158|nr:hypothetical protein K5X82_02670 [Prolixibacteraceae bacterium]
MSSHIKFLIDNLITSFENSDQYYYYQIHWTIYHLFNQNKSEIDALIEKEEDTEIKAKLNVLTNKYYTANRPGIKYFTLTDEEWEKYHDKHFTNMKRHKLNQSTPTN